MFKRIAMAVGLVFAIAGCAPVVLTPEAQRVVLSPNPPPAGCHYVGSVTGNQGNFFTGAFTSNANLETGAMNNVKNQAASLGANYVQMVTNRAGVSGGGQGGGTQQTNVTYTGNAYRCPHL
jgi:hypothetical protein